MCFGGHPFVEGLLFPKAGTSLRRRPRVSGKKKYILQEEHSSPSTTLRDRVSLSVEPKKSFDKNKCFQPKYPPITNQPFHRDSTEIQVPQLKLFGAKI